MCMRWRAVVVAAVVVAAAVAAVAPLPASAELLWMTGGGCRCVRTSPRAAHSPPRWPRNRQKWGCTKSGPECGF
ncbi:hypothetical protein B484DRAFT_459656 [Ochromonadaceae sp. CCMP2298]|nr:hypothetical protein B484DRAFT_459656 [Ochromonadaceae sp. CCMP2298]